MFCSRRESVTLVVAVLRRRACIYTSRVARTSAGNLADRPTVSQSRLEMVHDVPPSNDECSRPIEVAGRTLTPTPVFDTYWRFAAARQAIYLARLQGMGEPWSDDPILREYRFTNVYRAADRVSQYLIQKVIYDTAVPDDPENVVFRVLLFKLFNRISTWRTLEQELGTIEWRTFNFSHYCRVLDATAKDGPIYSAAYLMPPPKLGERYKHHNHLRLLEQIVHDGFPRLVASSKTLTAIYERLIKYPSVGRFLGFQYTVDMNYTPLMSASENQFVVAGPGACDGIRKCFGPEASGIEPGVIRYMVEHQDFHFARLKLEFDGLFGRSLHLIDCQNLFCEVDPFGGIRYRDSGEPLTRGGGRSRHYGSGLRSQRGGQEAQQRGELLLRGGACPGGGALVLSDSRVARCQRTPSRGCDRSGMRWVARV